jgi:signal transduction histidine kinase
MQILVNLINNSLKFTRINGQIKLSFKLKKNDKIKMSVKDDGIGFELNKLTTLQKIMNLKKQTLFSRMKYTVNQKSANLGLYISN